MRSLGTPAGLWMTMPAPDQMGWLMRLAPMVTTPMRQLWRRFQQVAKGMIQSVCCTQMPDEGQGNGLLARATSAIAPLPREAEVSQEGQGRQLVARGGCRSTLHCVRRVTKLLWRRAMRTTRRLRNSCASWKCRPVGCAEVEVQMGMQLVSATSHKYLASTREGLQSDAVPL